MDQARGHYQLTATPGTNQTELDQPFSKPFCNEAFLLIARSGHGFNELHNLFIGDWPEPKAFDF